MKKINKISLFLLALTPVIVLMSLSTHAQDLYVQLGNDVPFQQLIDKKILPVGVDSDFGVKGSTIDVNNQLVELGPYATNTIEQEIGIHTVANSSIIRRDFARWTRWYQEDGNTQVFRLFKGEYNVRNDRPLAARIEAHSDLRWSRGIWHEWVGRYTIAKPMGAAIFQVFNANNQWAFQLNMGANGDIILNHRRHQDDQIIARNMVGKSFDIRARDNGNDYEVYLNGTKVGAGYYDRPVGTSSFRWGMYVGETEVTQDGILFVTGATVDPKPNTTTHSSKPSLRSSSSAITRSSSSTIARSSITHSSSSIASDTGNCVYKITQQWNSGFTASIQITNKSNKAINNWNVNWIYTDGSKVTSTWNASVTGNNPYSATGVTWNETIQPGQSVEFGFQGTKSNATTTQIPTIKGGACQ